MTVGLKYLQSISVCNIFQLTFIYLRVAQGPALYVYNDAVFTADDWKGIRMLNDSVKEKDPMKVGRFGLGFKSVFHMTGIL